MTRKLLAEEYLATHEPPPALEKLIRRYEATVNGFRGDCEHSRKRGDEQDKRLTALEGWKAKTNQSKEISKIKMEVLLVSIVLVIVSTALGVVVFCGR